MRKLVLGSWGHRVSWTLIATLLLPLLVLAGMPGQARAQVTRLPAVAVLEFDNLTSVKLGGILGRQATDAVVVEMTRTGRFDITPRQQLNQQLDDLGLTPPLDNIGIRKLGQALGVDSVSTGAITSVVFTENPRRARVTLSVQLTDVVSGEFSNGAIATGYSSATPPGMQPDDESLVSQAIANAAYNAVTTINNYTLPEATILTTRDNTEVRLNRGARDGISPGLEMTVVRGNDRVGRVRVTDVGSTDSTASIVDIGKGIRPEDRARAIFKLPGVEVAEDGRIIRTTSDVRSYSPGKKKNKSVIGTVLSIAAAVLLASFLFNKNSKVGGQGGANNIQARAFAEPSVVTALDPSASRVRVEWNPAADVPINNVIEFQIFRDNQIIAAVPPNQRSFDDSATLAGNVTYNIITFGGGGTTATGGTATAGGTTATGGTATAGGTTATGGTATGGTATAGGTATGGTATGGTPDQPNSLTRVTQAVTPMQVGVPHRYQVRTLYRRIQAPQQGGNTTGGGNQGGGVGGNQGGGVGGNQGGGVGGNQGGGVGGNQGGGGGNQGGGGGGNQGGGGTTTQILFTLTPLRDSQGQATPISRPRAVGPISDRNLNDVRFEFNTVPGANEYTVEVADNPAFANKKIVQFNGQDTFFLQFANGATTVLDTVDLTLGRYFPQYASSIPAGTRIYIRVGARNSLDDPGVLPLGTPNPRQFIYSAESISFGTISPPPPPPGGATAGGSTAGGSTAGGSTAGGPPPPPGGGSTGPV